MIQKRTEGTKEVIVMKEHLSKEFILHVIRQVPPLAKFELDADSYTQSPSPLIKIKSNKVNLHIPIAWMVKLGTTTMNKFLEFMVSSDVQVGFIFLLEKSVLSFCFQEELREIKRAKKGARLNMDINSNEVLET